MLLWLLFETVANDETALLTVATGAMVAEARASPFANIPRRLDVTAPVFGTKEECSPVVAALSGETTAVFVAFGVMLEVAVAWEISGSASC